MKKYFTLAMLVVAAFLVSAQSYRPFPDSGYFWNEEHGRLTPGTCGFEYHTCDIPVFFGVDTAIGTVTYHQLFYRQICHWQYTGPMPPPPPCQYSGTYNYGTNLFACIRQDTSQKKVFIYDLASHAEMLLYDFNLSAGDTLPPAYNNPGYPNVFVARTDSILLTDGYHKRFVLNVTTLSMADSVAIIEGVGSTFGLTAALVTPFENHDLLVCFSGTAQTIYPDASVACSISLGVKPVTEGSQCEVYPNPFVDYLDITKKDLAGNVSIQLIQPDGRLVMEQNLASEHMRLHLPRLSCGIYFIRFETSLGIVTRKLAKEQ